MRRDSRLTTITEALQTGPGNNRRAHRIWGRAAGAAMDDGAIGNVYAADIHDLAVHIYTRLYGRPAGGDDRSPLAQAEAAKRARDLVGEVGALMSAGADLESAPWYPVRPGDLVHLHYETTPTLPAYRETYVIRDAIGGLLEMRLLTHTFTSGDPDKYGVGTCAVEAADDPIYELWFEAGPQRLTIVRDGQVVHDGPGRRGAATAGTQAEAAINVLAAAVCEAELYLERGEPELALARLRSHKKLPPCGAPGFTTEQPDCARPRGHAGACSDNPDYTEPPHECPALPEQLHAVVTVGAKVTDVHFAGLYADRDAATDHASGFSPWCHREDLTERYVKPAPGLPGEMLLELPKENELAATGVQLAVVVPLQVLPDPRAEDEWAAEGMATALSADDYADDYDDDYRDDE